MRTWFWPGHTRHDPSTLNPPAGSADDYYADSPSRGQVLLDALRHAALGELREAPPTDLRTDLAMVHHPGLLAHLATAHERWAAEAGPVLGDGRPDAAVPETFAIGADRLRSSSVWAELGWYCYDTSSPVGPGTWDAAVGAATAACAAADDVQAGAPCAYALVRPPGHHAGGATYGGFCYLNNAAVAARRLQARGRRVAVIDVDAHHGNGTQDIFWNDPEVFVASVHMDPAEEYPYHWGYEDEVGGPEAEGTNLNVPLPLGTGEARYLVALEMAVSQVAHFRPDVVVLSLGVDTHRDDPLGRFELPTTAYRRIGELVASLGVPTVAVQEGGYHQPSLGASVLGVLRVLAEELPTDLPPETEAAT